MVVMDFLALAKKRFSTRGFDGSAAVGREDFEKILEAGRIAPTAANLQPQVVLAVRTKEGLEKLKKAGNVYGAPLALVICADHGKSWKRPFDGKDSAETDAAIVASHMILEATDLGLQSIWVGYFKPDAIREEFGLPAGVEPLGILGIGRGTGEPKSPDRHASERKPLSETVRYETF
jgi:nitroreductase